MKNKKNHNHNIFSLEMDKSEIYDFHLYDGSNNLDYNHLYDNEYNNLIVHIDTNNGDCVLPRESLISKYEHIDAYNNNLSLNNIGLTGVDNGYINYDKDNIENEEFLDLFTNSKLEYKSRYNGCNDDTHLILHQINGNNKILDYNTELTNIDGVTAAKLNGGFYQGFWKSGNNYDVLPNLTNIEEPITFEFILKKHDFPIEKDNEYKLNDRHPENKGLFFFIGTRAENKWLKNYNINYKDKDDIINTYFADDYFVLEEDYYEKLLNSQYIQPIETETNEFYTYGDYVDEEYYVEKVNKEVASGIDWGDYDLENSDIYFNDDYLKENLYIDPNADLGTSDGDSLHTSHQYQITTDNKFLIFDRTKGGFQADDWDEGTKILYTLRKKPNIGNYFLLFNRTENGLQADKIDKVLSENQDEYNIHSDLYNNAMGFQIKDDGSIGYKYLIKNCDNSDDNYLELVEGFSKSNIITEDTWHRIHIQIIPNSKKFFNLSFYVDGNLVFISKDLPSLNFRKLNDLDTKQEGVPFNISVGGGSQGLSDSIYLNYQKPPVGIYPIEKYFGGSFIGYFKEFKIYNNLNFNEIRDISECGFEDIAQFV